MIRIIRKSEKDRKRNFVASFNFTKEEADQFLLHYYVLADDGYEQISSFFKKGVLKVTSRESVENKEDYENIDYGWDLD